MNKPCEHCPWRLANQGKRTPWGFYTKLNLRRLWNQLRAGGMPQSCHPTDPSHPDHVAAGAKRGSKPRECPGSAILVLREVRAMSEDRGEGRHEVTPEAVDAYYRTRRKGLKRPNGLRYWLVQRIAMAHVPLMGGPPLPDVDVNDPEVGLPEELARG